MKIKPEYEKKVIPLHADQYHTLKESIRENGLWLPIITNSDGEILDGHHRFRACKELGFTPKSIVKDFETKTDEAIFVGECNFARRQFSNAERIEAVLKMEPLYIKQANERMSAGGKEGKQISAPLGQSRTIMAEKAHVSHDTFEKYKKILKSASAETIHKIKSGKTTINKEYKELQKKNIVTKPKKTKHAKHTPLHLPDHVSLHNEPFQTVPIPNNRVSLIFTHPPFDDKLFYLYNELAKQAARVLCNGGNVLCYVHQSDIGKVIELFANNGLSYQWQFIIKHTGAPTSTYGKKLSIHYKSLLWFSMGQGDDITADDFLDVEFQGNTINTWESGTVPDYYIEKFTKPQDIIYDPFLDSGLVGLSAIQQKRQFIGCTGDARKFEAAKKFLSIP